MATDTLATRERIAIVTTSINAVAQPEMEHMRPPGVTNHTFRIGVPNFPMDSAERFTEFAKTLGDDAGASILQALDIEPGQVILAASVDSAWPAETAAAMLEQCRGKGARLTTASAAIKAALQAFQVRKRVAILMPYSGKPADAVRSYLTGLGLDIVREAQITAQAPADLARISAEQIKSAFRSLDGSGAEAVVQFGAALPAVHAAAETEHAIGIPVIATNTALYWHALRACGIQDEIAGCGRLLQR